MKGVIQIGSHYAQEYPEWKAMGIKDFIFFEPIRSNYDKLIEILPQSDSIKVFNLALGNQTGEISMYVETANMGQSCSILKPKIHLLQWPTITFDSTEVVKIDKLDNIEYDRSLYDYICLDVQGYELEVLKGAVESLKSINELFVEVNNVELYENCAMFEDIIGFLRKNGFKLMEVDWVGITYGNAIFKR